jgi:hypothetical protein
MSLMSEAMTDLLVDSFTRIRDYLGDVLDGLGGDQLAWRPDEKANSIGWLAWHLTRVEDDHIAHAAGSEQIWTSAGWFERMALALPPRATGYGHGPTEVAAVRVESADLLRGYQEAVCDSTLAYVRGLEESDLGRIVDESWDPPVTLSVRLVSIISDGLQHVGQAAYVRGLLERTPA